MVSAELEVITTPVRLENGAAVEGKQINGQDWGKAHATALSIDGSRLISCDLSTSELKKFSMMDTIVDHGLFYGANFDGAGWLRVAVGGAIMSGIILSDASLKEVVFKDCKLDLANFRFTKFARIKFINCLMKEADFQGAVMNEVQFENCELEGGDFSQCQMKQVDLRTSTLTAVKGLASFSGATIDTGQLIGLAHSLAAEIGITVTD